MDKMVELESIDNTSKFVVFSSYKPMLDLISEALASHAILRAERFGDNFTNIDHLNKFLAPSTSSSSSNVLLLGMRSTGGGAAGMTLTVANVSPHSINVHS
jgi:hypothetical protein|tara:strand:+ start:2190 stop:2492 length:303 start_codon:yes stop_codon:yes gene_type:complete